MAVEVHQVELGKSVESIKEGELGLVFRARRCAAEVLDEDARVDLLLDVDWRGVGYEVLAVEGILPLPHQLGVERWVAGIADRHWPLYLRCHEVLGVSGG